jgi:hypothetical protein
MEGGVEWGGGVRRTQQQRSGASKPAPSTHWYAGYTTPTIVATSVWPSPNIKKATTPNVRKREMKRRGTPTRSAITSTQPSPPT